MKCEEVRDMLARLDSAESSLQQRFAYEHLRGCTTCRDAVHAVHVLKAEATRLVPRSSDGAFERALLAAARSADPMRRRDRNSFWGGAALGGAIAACLGAAVLLVVPLSSDPRNGTPIVSIAPNSVRDVRISLDSPEALAEAGIRVILSGAIALQGYEDRRELTWSTPLDRGVNELILPVVAVGPGGGQLLVEVASSMKRKTFLIDVRAEI